MSKLYTAKSPALDEQTRSLPCPSQDVINTINSINTDRDIHEVSLESSPTVLNLACGSVDSVIRVRSTLEPAPFEIGAYSRHWLRKNRFRILRGIAWVLSISAAAAAHFLFVHMVGPIDTDYLYADTAAGYRTFLIIYLLILSISTSLVATGAAIFVFRHYKEPLFRVLLPPFLLHLCSITILVPLVSMGRQMYAIYEIQLGKPAGFRFFVSFMDTTALGWLISAPLTRLCVMYNLYIRRNYDVKYHYVLLRVWVEANMFHFFYLAYLLPDNLHWISSAGYRLAIVVLVSEAVYYIFRLRNNKYAPESYAHLLYLTGYSAVVFVFIAIVLPITNKVGAEIDEFHAVLLGTWGMGIEVLGPPIWHTYRTQMGWETGTAACQSSEVCGDSLKEALGDPLLYPVLLECAKERFCEESVLFLHDGYPILKALDELKLDSTVMEESAVRPQLLVFLRTFLVKGAPTPVNLSGTHLTKFRELYRTIASVGIGKSTLNVKVILAQSLSEIADLVATSGVLTQYDKSDERQAIVNTRSALERLQQGVT